MMRASRKSLPDPRLWHRRVSWIGEAANETALRKIEIDEALQNLDDIPARVNEILGKVDGVKTRERLTHESLLGEHLQTQRDLLRAAADAFDRMLNGLSEYDARSRELIQEVEEFDAFIAERILWVESTNSLGKTDAPLLVGGAIDLIDPSRWLLAWDVVSKDFFKAFAFYATLIGAAVLSIVVRPRIRRLMRQMGEQVTKDYVGTPHLTLLALAGTIVMAGLVPLGLYLLGQHILASTAKFEVLSLGTSLQTTAAVLFSIGFVRQCCRPSGLAITHFRWRASSVAVLRRNLQWLAVILMPLFFATAILRYDVESPARTATVRVLFIAQMLSLAFFLYRTLHHSHAVAENLMGATASGWMKRLRVVWYPTAVLLPVSLGLFAGLGYLDSSLLLNDRLLATLSLAVGVVVVNAVLLRWLYAVRGQLALEQTRKRREAEQAAGSDHPAPAEAGIDLSLVNVQTRRMLSTGVGVAMLVGLLFIWSDIIPALRALERFAFWSKTEFVWETQTDADTGTTRLVRVEETTPVTLATFASVILMGFVAVAAARNVPGFLEVTLLARLPLDAGARFAISTVARYVISIAGLLICSNHLGIRWDSVQWLAAGFTVGLGFGLQEIVANFVSGLILLVERPIRIGDVVTVGDLHGSVSRIQMRATTITDWDRKELVVPNKEFITSKFINWTLSDRVLRLSFSVGIEYGEDTHRATQVLLDIARRQPHILADPPPSAFFESFGDSSLNLRLIAFVDNVDYALKIKHEMNTAINEAFTREKIGMAFPQRDVNVRFVPDADTLPKALSDLIAKDTPRRASA
jgi:potassium efflux system protein